MRFQSEIAGVCTAPHLAMGLLPGPSLEPDWRLVEEGFTLAREHEIESLFTVANGYLGVRASLPEGTSLSAPATFLAGVFDVNPESGVPHDLVILPDWTQVRIVIDSFPLSLEEGEILDHRRILDLQQGVLWREWRHRDQAGRITCLRLLRFASLSDRHLLLQSLLVTPENYAGRICLESCIEVPAQHAKGKAADAVTPIPWPSPRWTMRIRSGQDRRRLLCGKTSKGVMIALALASEVYTQAGKRIQPTLEPLPGGFIERWVWNQGIGETARFTRLVVVHSSRDRDCRDEAAVQHLNQALSQGFPSIASSHREAWRRQWDLADLRVVGDEPAQRALRFAVYHLLSAANPEDERASIGARALTGEAYRGHVFWDTEIYLLPFYTLVHPPTARALLMYRYHTLPAARDKARGLGYEGALFAWESTDTGEETTPSSALSPAGQIVRVLTGEQEHHISADIAYAVWQYWKLSGDDAFFLQAGAEIMLETARFWASRGRLEADGRYHIRGVIGPDQYHETVDDNAYTNVMAQWNLERGTETAELLSARWPDQWRSLRERLSLKEEPERWRQLAQRMVTGFDPRTRLFEQFAGYFGLEEVNLAEYAGGAIPPNIALGYERTQRSKVVKQADVVALCTLFRDQFPREVLEANFRYYEPRTAHGSSLSPAFHALVAARLGDLPYTERYFRQAAEIDLANTMGNAAGGVHIAALGGLWQAAVFGIAGMRLGENGLLFDPHLPQTWHEFSFRVRWRDRQVTVAMHREPRRVEVTLQGEESLLVGVLDGPVKVLDPGAQYTAEWDQRDERWRDLAPEHRPRAPATES